MFDYSDIRRNKLEKGGEGLTEKLKSRKLLEHIKKVVIFAPRITTK